MVPDDFVNRIDELDQFVSILNDPRFVFLSVSGEGGVGKTSLMEAMSHKCAIKKLKHIEIFLDSTRHNNYLGILRKLRDDLDEPAFFNEFNSLLNDMNEGRKFNLDINTGEINVGNSLNSKDSVVGNITGVIIEDLHITGQSSENTSEMISKLTSVFCNCLLRYIESFPDNWPLVFFFDSMEKASDQTRNWMFNDLFRNLQSDNNELKVVMCGRQQKIKELDELPSSIIRIFKKKSKKIKLEPLKKKHVREYLLKRNVCTKKSADVCTHMAMEASSGIPLKLAMLVDSFESDEQ